MSVKKRGSYKGVFRPTKPEKYRGTNVREIVFRSLWEYTVMVWLDTNPAVVWWSSESNIVRYYSQVDQRTRRYYPDFLVCFKDVKDQQQTVMLEIKPYAQTIEPIPPKRKTRKAVARYEEQIRTYITNQCKWDAARKFCSSKGWGFRVLTEREIYKREPK